MDKRSGARRKMRLAVRFGAQRPERLGFVTDVSSSGLRVETNAVLPRGSALCLDVELRDGRRLALNGRVMQSRAVPPALAGTLRGSMGIRLESPPPGWGDAIASAGSGDGG